MKLDLGTVITRDRVFFIAQQSSRAITTKVQGMATFRCMTMANS